MNTVQRIAKNTGVLLASQVVSYILGFFFIMYTARYLGAEGFGVLSFAIAFTGIFGVFADLGLQPLTVREVAKDKSLAGKYLGNIAVMKMILVIVTFGLIAFFINLLGYPEQTIKVVYLVALSIVFGTFSGMFNSVFQAYEKMEYASVGHILRSALMLSGALLAISQGFNVVGFASIYFLVNAVVLVYVFAVCAWKFVLPKIEVDWGFWKPTIKEALPFGLSGTFITIYVWIDSVMLSLMKGDVVVGWYNAAYMLVLVLLFIPTAFNSAVFPLMSQFYVSSMDSLKFMFEKHFKYMLTLGIPIGVGITLLANKIILLIFGAEYIPSAIALQILIWAIVLIFARTAFERVLEASNRQIIVTEVFGGCALLNVILNVILIPKYSYIGAAVATLITDFTVFVILFIWSLKIGYNIPTKQIVETISKVIAASLLMGVFIEYFRDQNLFILVFIATIIYFGLILLIRGIDKDDIRLFKNLFPKKELGYK
ncbi:MAG: Polysaccharide biosynthesis protein [Candidatus Argoarchaeum ethanivorans]|uniref:Polysaccharide biosynthesis protein n=1 Tax=Candidatus Argoarchaeum ethanivorans TaxID=2608793 RepID=A0A811T552_9EURY|nr:MAG: Polysaccharide biosynthesis protein [Candidatus Argoarchaeum ethanivorans]CAD6493492.1 MAG: Polysaccharide biosynthesis protein [Candidatus Argoarchaeum ethanivorans]